MTAFSVNPDALDGISRRLSSYAPETVSYSDNIGRINGARGAFSSSEDNDKYNETIDQIIRQHSQIETMYRNTTQRLSTVAANYRSAEQRSVIS